MLRSIPALTALLATAALASADWPMLGHDVTRSGATADEVRPPFVRKWYRAFPDEGLNAGVQPIVTGTRLYVGTLRGVLHAIDVHGGKDVWTYRAGGAILHACAADATRVYFGAADGVVYAVNSADGGLAWKVQTGAAVWNAPVLWNGRLFIGSRDDKLYGIDAEHGNVLWSAPTGGPLLNSPAVDPKSGHVYIGSEDMHVYAFDATTGRQLWKSEKLSGVSFRGYHPVVAPDGSVMITCQPCAGGDAIQQVLLEMVKDVFGDFASWRHKKPENDLLREQNFKMLANPRTYAREMAYLRNRLSDQPAYQTFFVLNPATGQQKFVTPLVYAESMNGPGAPPIVTSDGKVIVKYSALLRSRYEHYSPFLNVGYLDTTTGDITPIMDQSRTYGWHDSLLLVHDEQSQLAVGGQVLFNTHQDNVNAMDLNTLQGYPFPLAVNQHEVKGANAAAIWARYLDGRQLPVGWEWFERGTAVYGGGSAIDTSITIAGDSFYYFPSHELNAGVTIIAYRMDPGGKQADHAPAPTDKLTDAQWKQLQGMKWDWDTLATPRLNGLLTALPGQMPGTIASPAAPANPHISDAGLDEIIWRIPATAHSAATDPATQHLRDELGRAVDELISTEWRPLLFPATKAPSEAYRFFIDPAETIYTLALAYPHLPPPLQAKVRRRVEALRAIKKYEVHAGAIRSAYDPAPESLMRIVDDLSWSSTARIYPLWRWAQASNDWEPLRAEWPRLRELEADEHPIDCGNGRVAGLIAACRIARQVRDEQFLKQRLPDVRAAMRARVAYERAHTEGGVIVPAGSRTVFGRWRHLTPEVAQLIRRFAPGIEDHLIDVYLDHHRPTWWLAWNVELLWRNEAPLSMPTMSLDAFGAKALLTSEPRERLAAYVDLPWCKGDEFYIQKLAMLLDRTP